MLITIQLFGPQAELAGVRQLEVDLPEAEATAAAVLSSLETVAPALKPSLATSRLAINHEFAADADIITPADEVALIGMVSGG